jgi:predicted Rossmann fold flavoprotein
MSSYWFAGEDLELNFLPQLDFVATLKEKRRDKVKSTLKTVLDSYLPKRLIACLLPEELLTCTLPDLSDRQILLVAQHLQQWQIKPNATEGYRTAEVTLGGVDCDALSSKTMASKQVPGLYFIGEVVDVSGWLGGYNFQWAWSSAWCAGQYV